MALAIAEAAHPKAIQTRMGHSSISLTLDRYGHLFPELDEAIATSFGERLLAARSSGTALCSCQLRRRIAVSSRLRWSTRRDG